MSDFSSTDALAQHGREGFDRLYERLAPAIHVWVALRIPAGLKAYMAPEDVSQEVWFQASRSSSTFDPARGTFRAWIFRVAKNVLLQAIRRSRRPDVQHRVMDTGAFGFALDQIPVDVTTVCRRLSRDESIQRILALLREFSDEDKDLLVHCGLEEMNHRTVGEMMGLSTDAVHKRWQRLRVRITATGVPDDLLATVHER